MTVVVYGKPGCGLCEAAKRKLETLAIPYEYRDIAPMLALHDGWRQNGSVDVLAAYTQAGTLPIIGINGEYVTYPEAMRRLRRVVQ